MNIGLSLASTAATALLGRQIMTQAISDASYSIYSSIGEIFYYIPSFSDTSAKHFSVYPVYNLRS